MIQLYQWKWWEIVLDYYYIQEDQCKIVVKSWIKQQMIY